MKPYYPQSLKNSTFQTIETLNKYPGDGLGNVVGEKIIEKTEEICSYLDSIKGRSNFSELITRRFTATLCHPKIYGDNGYENCHDLFFEQTFKIGFDGDEVLAGVMFYIPAMFVGGKQKEVMCSFTKKGKLKANDIECVEFYSAFSYVVPGRG